MIPGNWQITLMVLGSAFVGGGFAFVAWPRKRGATRRNQVLPPPSAACKRNTVQSVP